MYFFTGNSDKATFLVVKDKKTKWSLSVHTVVWDFLDCRQRKKVREEHCLVCYSAIYSSKVPLLPSSSTLMEENFSVKQWCCSTKLHGVTYKRTVMLVKTSQLTRCRKFHSMISGLPQSTLINVYVNLNNP